MNAIMAICPYRHNGMWVFDDERVGLVQEPFVCGIPEIIDLFVGKVANSESGFRLLFSGGPFPGYQLELERVRAEYEGNWYRWAEGGMEGWLCPALFRYFDDAPDRIYCRAEPMQRS